MPRSEIASLTGVLLPHEQEKLRSQRSLDDYPAILITQETYIIPSLMHDRRVTNPRYARNFLKGETSDYIRAAEKVEPGYPLGENPSLFRTFEFFRVASELPIAA